MTKKTKLIVAAILVILGVACRLLPHAWNFAPIAAIALFAGVYIGRNYAISLPIVTMIIGDFFIGFYEWRLMLVVYGCYVLIGLIGFSIKKHKSIETVIASSITASVIFFIFTNWAVWQFSPWYAKSIEGLMQCYILALPFFRNTLLGNFFYVFALFGSYEVVMFLARRETANFETVK